MKILIIIICSIAALLLLLFLSILAYGNFSDFLAKKKAESYCDNNKLDFIKVELFPNHYGLYFKYESKQYYAPFDFEANRTISWKKGDPFERIKETMDKRKSAAEKRRKK